MATFVFVHGAGDVGWYWHLVEADLQARGHATIAPDLPCDDDAATLDDYAAAVIAATGERQDLVIVGQSYGSFAATLAASEVPTRLLVLVAGMVPAPGETPGEWWTNTGYRAGSDDPLVSFYKGVPPELAQEAMRRGDRGESTAVWNTPWPLDAWPDVPTRFVLCRDDNFFPAAFLRRVVRERLGVVPDEIAGGHCVALSHPKELADRLMSYLDIHQL